MCKICLHLSVFSKCKKIICDFTQYAKSGLKPQFCPERSLKPVHLRSFTIHLADAIFASVRLHGACMYPSCPKQHFRYEQ